MSRSFRETYLGLPYQAIRGWYKGKNRERAKMTRYRLAAMVDEEGIPVLLARLSKKWRNGLGSRCWQPPQRCAYRVLMRNGRKYLVRTGDSVAEEE